MLGRTHRFHGRKALNGAYRHGKTVRTSAMSLRYSHRPSDRPYRVAVVVSRKVSKSAVTRNRIRRRIYAIVRNSGDVISPGTDMIFTVFSDKLAEVPSDSLQATVTELLRKTA